MGAAGLFRRRDLFPSPGIARAAFCAQSLEGPQHIFRGHRASIRESGTFAQGEGDKAAGRVRLDRFGQKPVQREGFVHRPAHQRLNRQGRELAGRLSLYDEGVERIEPARHSDADRPATVDQILGQPRTFRPQHQSDPSDTPVVRKPLGRRRRQRQHLDAGPL